MKKFFVFLAIAIFLSACTQQKQVNFGQDFESRSEVDRATLLCQKLCIEKKQQADFSSGPCLSNEIIPNWVCDVSHFPRTEADNLAENQCSAFREGKAGRFVELDTGCEVIQTA